MASKTVAHVARSCGTPASNCAYVRVSTSSNVTPAASGTRTMVAGFAPRDVRRWPDAANASWADGPGPQRRLTPPRPGCPRRAGTTREPPRRRGRDARSRARSRRRRGTSTARRKTEGTGPLRERFLRERFLRGVVSGSASGSSSPGSVSANRALATLSTARAGKPAAVKSASASPSSPRRSSASAYTLAATAGLAAATSAPATPPPREAPPSPPPPPPPPPPRGPGVSLRRLEPGGHGSPASIAARRALGDGGGGFVDGLARRLEDPSSADAASRGDDRRLTLRGDFRLCAAASTRDFAKKSSARRVRGRTIRPCPGPPTTRGDPDGRGATPRTACRGLSSRRRRRRAGALERERAEDDRATVVDVLVGGAQEGRLHRGGVDARRASLDDDRERAPIEIGNGGGVGGGAGTRPAGGGENGIGVRRGKETGGGKTRGDARARAERGSVGDRRGGSTGTAAGAKYGRRMTDEGRAGGTARRYAHLRGGVAVRLRHGARRAEGSVSPGTRPRAARACDRGRGGRRPTSGSNGQLDGCAAGRRLVDRRRDKT